MAPRVLCTETDEVARNGALQRKNFGQRFSWAPLAFFASVLAEKALPFRRSALPIPQTARLLWILDPEATQPSSLL